MVSLRDKFRGCLLGAMVGDVAGAVVEAETPAFIARRYRSVDDMLAAGEVEEFTGPAWRVGRYTDDTQMTLCVAEWLAAGEVGAPQQLLARFSDAHERWRRYGPGTESILALYREYPAEWRSLATSMFPHGSYGNGSAMRVAPVGLAYFDDVAKLSDVAVASSRVTHSHPLALQGATLQALAVATAVRQGVASSAVYLEVLRAALAPFADLLQDVSRFSGAVDAIEQGLARGAPCAEMAGVLGTGVDVFEAVPMAIYCFLRHAGSLSDVVHQACFIGGDTDTIASMAGAIAGASLGRDAIPTAWLARVCEERYTPAVVEALADRLREAYHPDAA
jgi:poly(ADP-ribose) glycohydrolase ARH3